MELTVKAKTDDEVKAGFACSCGCRPSVRVTRAVPQAESMCCCGALFVVGAGVVDSLPADEGARAEVREFDSPWGQRLQAALVIK